MTTLQIIRGHPFLTKKQVAAETGRTTRTVENKIKGIRQEIEKGRYSPYALPDGLINWYVYVDFLTYEKLLSDKYLRKSVPEFNPAEIEKISGFKQQMVVAE